MRTSPSIINRNFFCFFHHALLSSPLAAAYLKHLRVFLNYRADEEEKVVEVSTEAGSASWQNFFEIAKVPLMISRVEDNAPIRVNDALSTYIGLSKEDIYATGSSFCVSFNAKPIADSPVRFPCPSYFYPILLYACHLPSPVPSPSACPYASFLSVMPHLLPFGVFRTLSG